MVWMGHKPFFPSWNRILTLSSTETAVSADSILQYHDSNSDSIPPFSAAAYQITVSAYLWLLYLRTSYLFFILKSLTLLIPPTWDTFNFHKALHWTPFHSMEYHEQSWAKTVEDALSLLSIPTCNFPYCAVHKTRQYVLPYVHGEYVHSRGTV